MVFSLEEEDLVVTSSTPILVAISDTGTAPLPIGGRVIRVAPGLVGGPPGLVSGGPPGLIGAPPLSAPVARPLPPATGGGGGGRWGGALPLPVMTSEKKVQDVKYANKKVDTEVEMG